MRGPPDVRRAALAGRPRESDLAQEIDAAEHSTTRQRDQVRAARRFADRFGLTVPHALVVVELAGIGGAL